MAYNPDFASFRKSTDIIPIWDDHDYGKNDAGREFAVKQRAKNAFLKFFDIPKEDAPNDRDGLYHAQMLEHDGRTILLDTRWFRDFPPAKSGQQNATILGNAQWQWLEARNKEQADLHILPSSIQVIPEAHRWEKWANFPAERERLIKLTKDSNAKVIIINGDRHLGEISAMSKQETSLSYDLYEITASGLTSAIGSAKGEEAPHQIGKNYRDDHFGLLTIHWDSNLPRINAETIDAATGQSVRSQTITFPKP